MQLKMRNELLLMGRQEFRKGNTAWGGYLILPHRLGAA